MKKIVYIISGIITTFVLTYLSYDLPIGYKIILGGSILIVLLSIVFIKGKDVIKIFELSLIISMVGVLMMIVVFGITDITNLKSSFISLFSSANLGQPFYKYFKG